MFFSHNLNFGEFIRWITLSTFWSLDDEEFLIALLGKVRWSKCLSVRNITSREKRRFSTRTRVFPPHPSKLYCLYG